MTDPYETYEEGLFQSTDEADPMSEGAVLEAVIGEVTEQHVYHHSAAREPYGNLTMGKNAKGDRTFTIEIKGVTPENFDQAVALREKLHLEAVKPDPEPIVVQTVSLDDLIGGEISLHTLVDRDYPEEVPEQPIPPKPFAWHKNHEEMGGISDGEDVLPAVSEEEVKKGKDYFESAR